MMKNEAILQFIKKYTQNQLIGYFLLMWGLTFLFSSLSGFEWLVRYGSGIDWIIDGLWNLTEIGCAAVLGMLGLKILEKEETKTEE